MAHKMLIGGTAYEISGGKTLVDGTAYSIKNGKTLVGGTAYEVGFGSWPDDLDTGLEFVSASAFSISVASPGWNGTMEYSNGSGWQAWDGSEILSGETDSGQCIYVRGTENTKVTGSDISKSWILAGTGVECNGNIEKLLDYTTVRAGSHPTMTEHCYYSMFEGCTALTKAPSLPATTLTEHCYYSMFRGCTALTKAPSLPATTLMKYCYYSMFEGCTALTKAPSLPATTLAQACYYNMFNDCTALTEAPSLPATTLVLSCYRDMFRGCTALTTVPSLPATTLAGFCYNSMFEDCINIKVSSTQTGTYTRAYRIPTTGTGTVEGRYQIENMFTNTGGTFTGTPTINTTYYLDSSNTIV